MIDLYNLQLCALERINASTNCLYNTRKFYVKFISKIHWCLLLQSEKSSKKNLSVNVSLIAVHFRDIAILAFCDKTAMFHDNFITITDHF